MTVKLSSRCSVLTNFTKFSPRSGSSPAVGSSSTSNSGSSASARANATRLTMPPRQFRRHQAAVRRIELDHRRFIQTSSRIISSSSRFSSRSGKAMLSKTGKAENSAPLLEQHAETIGAGRDLNDPVAEDRRAEQADLALRRSQQPDDFAQQRRLATAGTADRPKHFATMDRQGRCRDGPDITETRRDALDVDDRKRLIP